MIRIDLKQLDDQIKQYRTRLKNTDNQELRNALYSKIGDLRSIQQEWTVPYDKFNRRWK